VEAWSLPLDDGGSVQVRATDRGAGDLRIDGEPASLFARRSAVVDRPWVWVRQVHGAEVLVVAPDDDPVAVAGREADAVVTTRADVALAVHGADCGVLALSSPEGVVGVVHAGWRGLEAGVVAAAAEAVHRLGASRVEAVVGPCIGPECYEFGVEPLGRLRGVLGPEVIGTTRQGTPALDVPAALEVSLARAGVDVVGRSGRCTACAPDELWSFRARGDEARQAVVAWRELPAVRPGSAG
jgi:YfiH family protein